MVKDLDSTYLPNERKGHWVKLKPEYIDGVGDDLDLLVVGGYYGKGDRRGGSISHFMLGVVRSKEDVTPDGKQVYFRAPNTIIHLLLLLFFCNTRFLSFAKVGSGYSDNELKILQGQLRDHWRNYDPRRPPKFLRLMDGLKEKPDVWIEPEFSRVLQVKAAQVVPTDKFCAGVTLRFPRVTRLRTDKTWHEATTLEEILQLREQFQGHYGKRTLAGLVGDDRRRPKRARRGDDGNSGGDGDGCELDDGRRKHLGQGPRSLSVHPMYRDTDTSNVKQVSSIFEGMEFCVMNGTKEHDKPELETLIVQHGGAKVQYPFEGSTFCVLAATQTLKVRNIVESRRFDVVSIAWLLDCVSEKRLLQLGPKYMIFTTERTKELLLGQYDRFGDSYTEDATPQSLREAFAQVGKQLHSEGALHQQKQQQLGETHSLASQSTFSQSFAARDQDPEADSFESQSVDILGLERHYFKEKVWWSIFRGVTVYCDLYAVPGDVSTKLSCSSLDPSASLIKFYSGTVQGKPFTLYTKRSLKCCYCFLFVQNR